MNVNEKMFQALARAKPELKLSELRKEVLSIMRETNNPISAYDILAALKSRREGAAPPTVYRVIEYFLESGVIHKINSENKYVLCNHIKSQKSGAHSIIFICNQCSFTTEFTDNTFLEELTSLSTRHSFFINDLPLEIMGTCKRCKSFTD